MRAARSRRARRTLGAVRVRRAGLPRRGGKQYRGPKPKESLAFKQRSGRRSPRAAPARNRSSHGKRYRARAWGARGRSPVPMPRAGSFDCAPRIPGDKAARAVHARAWRSGASLRPPRPCPRGPSGGGSGRPRAAGWRWSLAVRGFGGVSWLLFVVGVFGWRCCRWCGWRGVAAWCGCRVAWRWRRGGGVLLRCWRSCGLVALVAPVVSGWAASAGSASDLRGGRSSGRSPFLLQDRAIGRHAYGYGTPNPDATPTATATGNRAAALRRRCGPLAGRGGWRDSAPLLRSRARKLACALRCGRSRPFRRPPFASFASVAAPPLSRLVPLLLLRWRRQQRLQAPRLHTLLATGRGIEARRQNPPPRDAALRASSRVAQSRRWPFLIFASASPAATSWPDSRRWWRR